MWRKLGLRIFFDTVARCWILAASLLSPLSSPGPRLHLTTTINNNTLVPHTTSSKRLFTGESMPRKQISRVPATPRLIRDIKPKRYHPKSDTLHQTDADDDDSSLLRSNATSNSFAATLSAGSTRQRFHKAGGSGAASNPVEEESKTHTTTVNNNNSLYDKWERYKRLPPRKKIRQLLWSMILYYSLRMIYFVDLESSSTSSNTGYENHVNVKSVSKTSLLDAYPDLGGVAESGKYDFLGNPIDRSGSFKSGLSSGAKSFDFLGKPIESKGYEMRKANDVLGNVVDPSRDSVDRLGHGASKSQQFSDSLGFSGGKLSSSFDSSPSQTKSLGAFDKGTPTKLNEQSDALSGELANRAITSGEISKSFDSSLNLLSDNSAQSNTLNGLSDIRPKNSYNSLRSNTLESNSVHTSKNLLTMDAASDAIISSSDQLPSLSTLNCRAHGGPSQSDSNEVVYWHNIQSDASFTSPFYSPKSQEQTRDGSNNFWKTKYLTFEMDGSGFNNMRLGFENVMLMAHAMGRTLVMPPKRQLAHGLRDLNGRKIVSFSDFYDIAAISAEQSGLNIISMEQFLEREALNGNLKGQYPPENRIKWDNQPLHPLWDYISNVTDSFDWHPNECILAFPRDGSDGQDLLVMMDDILKGSDGRSFPQPSEYQGKPTRVDAPTMERLREVLGGRKKIFIYDRNIHLAHDVVHFKANETDGTRLITQFYAFLWFEDWRQDLWAKRFVRDHLRYRDEIMCLAARVVAALRARARQDLSNVNGDYDAIHVRRTDFQSQFPDTDISASDLLTQLQKTVKSGSTLFIATDEHNQTFFKDIQAVYDVRYLGDFSSEIASINPNYFGLVEQIVASRSRIFIGTYYSSFSAFIGRLRGYYSVKERKEGYQNGALRDTYYVPGKYKNAMRLYQSVQPPFYARDFPSAWRDIDHLDLSVTNDALEIA